MNILWALVLVIKTTIKFAELKYLQYPIRHLYLDINGNKYLTRNGIPHCIIAGIEQQNKGDKKS